MDDSAATNQTPTSVKTINYQALASLQSQKHQAEAQALISQPRKANRKIYPRIAGTVVVCIVAFAIFPAAGILLLIVGIGWLILYAAKQSKKVKAATAQFLADNGWQPAVPPMFDLSLVASPISFKHSMTDGFTGSFGPNSFWSYFYYSYSQTVNNRNPNQRISIMQVISVALSNPLPRFYLADKAGGHATENFFQQHQTGMQPVKLEGDFNNYFTLYMDPDNQADVLTIIDPSRMLELVQHGGFVEVLALGDNYVHFLNTLVPAMDPVYTRNFFDFSQQFTAMLDRALVTFRVSQPAAPAPVEQIITPTVTPA